ncbi:MAG: response regulator transcription factor [Gammaproteobacteria bacterium]
MANKILVVENDECSRTGIAAFFEAYGFEVRSTDSAQQAIALGRSFIPDILISDWMLGGDCDGVDVARALFHASCPQLAIIFVTGHPTDQLRSEAFGLPVHSFMRKPLSLFDLRTAVDLIIKRSPDDKS